MNSAISVLVVSGSLEYPGNFRRRYNNLFGALAASGSVRVTQVNIVFRRWALEMHINVCASKSASKALYTSLLV